MRQVGIPNAEAGVITAAAFEEEIEFRFTSNGYTLHDSHFLGDVRDASGNSLGYKMMMVFVKDETPTARKTLKET
jgi:hypothetical protein